MGQIPARKATLLDVAGAVGDKTYIATVTIQSTDPEQPHLCTGCENHPDRLSDVAARRGIAAGIHASRRLPSIATNAPNTTSTPPAANVRLSHWCMLPSPWPTIASAIWRISPVVWLSASLT